jgi:hypothetical protein
MESGLRPEEVQATFIWPEVVSDVLDFDVADELR